MGFISKKEELELAELDFENAKEALERLKNLQKTDLNYWAQMTTKECSHQQRSSLKFI